MRSTDMEKTKEPRNEVMPRNEVKPMEVNAYAHLFPLVFFPLLKSIMSSVIS